MTVLFLLLAVVVWLVLCGLARALVGWRLPTSSPPDTQLPALPGDRDTRPLPTGVAAIRGQLDRQKQNKPWHGARVILEAR